MVLGLLSTQKGAPLCPTKLKNSEINNVLLLTNKIKITFNAKFI